MYKKSSIVPNINFDFMFGAKKIAGIDEVGKGPWAGPVVSAIVLIDMNSRLPKEINDSKKLSIKKREYLYSIIVQSCEFGISIISNEIINKIGIKKASILSMENAFENLSNAPEIVLIDGRDKINIQANTVNIIKGDTKSVSIAAASIVAKVTRDQIMQNIAKIYPDYNFENNVGYGTKQHMEAIKNFGITPIHRKSFAPIKFFSNQ